MDIPLPPVTILIPAKDEGERIRACLTSALSQDYPNFRVIAIDDRSTDRTGAIMDEIAAIDPQLETLHIRQDPAPGWTGKNNALYIATQQAQGDWLLFVDSDVILEKDTLSAAMAVVLRKKFDLLSLLPKLESHSFWESILVPLAGSAASSLYLIALTNKSAVTSKAFANGQFMLMSRACYDAIGGHATVRDRFCEDVEIAQLLKKHGFKPRVSWGTEFAAVRMYSSLGAIFRGWGRIFYSARVGQPWTILMGISFLIQCCFSGYAALAWGTYRLSQPSSIFHGYIGVAWVVTALVHLSLMTWLLGVMYAWCGNPRRNALLFPIGGTLLLLIFLKALTMCVTRKVEWRGTAYSHAMSPELAPATSAVTGNSTRA
jgi:chlorobactene glucosyltransferase